MLRILGIDPGSRTTGYGLIEKTGSGYQCVHWGQLKLVSEECASLPQRLQQIFSGLSSIIQHYQPTVMAIEAVFAGQNIQSALKLGQARGVAIVAGTQAGLSVHEYAPRLVKQVVTGQGAADKEQVQKMVIWCLNLTETPPPDAADALAIALCHAYTETTRQQGLLADNTRLPLATRRKKVRWA